MARRHGAGGVRPATLYPKTAHHLRRAAEPSLMRCSEMKINEAG